MAAIRQPVSTLEISFEGNVLEIYGIKAPNHLMFTVSIDGGEAVECDGYGPSRTDGNQLLYSSEDAGIELENTAHTALLTVLDQSNEAAVNAQGISITYAKVYGGEVSEPEEPEFPGYSDVDDATSTSSGELRRRIRRTVLYDEVHRYRHRDLCQQEHRACGF